MSTVRITTHSAASDSREIRLALRTRDVGMPKCSCAAYRVMQRTQHWQRCALGVVLRD